MDTEDLPDLFVNFNITFKATRVVGNRLIPTTWKLKSEVIYDDDSELDDDTYDFNVEVAFSKIKFWFDNVVDNSLMLNRDNTWAQRAFLDQDGKQSVDNQLVILPNEPTDATLAEVLQSKMNALSGNSVSFGLVELTSDDDSGLNVVFTGVGEFNLPDMEEWVGTPSFFTKPWWARDDASTIDVLPTEDADLSTPPAFAYSLDFIADALRPPTLGAATIIRPEFKPQVIDGGLKDD